jgi:hypothetical protein
MLHERRISPLAIDLTRMHPRTVTSFYSNLVTRPTGRAVRMGVESQIAELPRDRTVCLSILDFSQVRIVDYSCADEIVAKLLQRYAPDDRPAEVYFLVRGVQEHHQEAIDAVLEHHDLLACAEDEEGDARLLGRSSVVQRRCWGAITELRHADVRSVAERASLAVEAVSVVLEGLAARRVVVPLRDGRYCSVASLLVEGHA